MKTAIIISLPIIILIAVAYVLWAVLQEPDPRYLTCRYGDDQG